jgi:transcriptional regulator with XRE-family HTH domain
MENPVASFAQLVRHYRAEAGLTQQEIAEKAGVSISYMTLLETGRRQKPSWDTVCALANAFGLKGNERRAFIRSSGYSEDAVGKTPVDLSPPMLKVLSEFLALSPGDPQGPAILRKALDALTGMVAEKALPGNQKKVIKAVRLVTSGYFSSTFGKNAGKKIPPDDQETVLADLVRELIESFTDGAIPLNKRISNARELVSYMKWKSKEPTSKQ